MGGRGVDYVAQNVERWRAVVNAVMNFAFRKMQKIP
jgi:hypothetical protein